MFDKDYYEKYLQRGSILRTFRGDRGIQYAFWRSYLGRKFNGHNRVLEVGCGLGFFGKRAQQNFYYTGVDISLYALHYAKETNKVNNVITSRAEWLPFKEKTFDAIIAFDLIEHLINPKIFFEEVLRILKDNGLLIVTTPNIFSFGVRVKSKSRSLKPSMYTDESHVSLLPPDRWAVLLESVGFHIIKRGTDNLWDIPYFEHIPPVIQKLIFVPFNLVTSFLGVIPWPYGENLILVAEK